MALTRCNRLVTLHRLPFMKPSCPVATQFVILLVDDNPHGLVARKKVLGDLGYQVETAGSAEEALIKVEKRGFHLVVTDYKMLRMNGVELISQLRANHPGVKTILLSGFVNILGMTVESTGANAVVNKDAAEVVNLTRAVERVLRPSSSVRRKPVKSHSGGAGGAASARTA